jgi:aminopeptidase N
VAFKWNEESKLAEVTIKQTQEAEAFCFPLTLEFRTKAGSAPTLVTREIAEKQTTVCVSLPARPVMFVVDPADSVLKEITENKPRDLWQAQLSHENAIARIRAVQSLAKDKTDSNRAALAAALRNEKFSGVAVEIAGFLGDLGGDACRDALVEAVARLDPRGRRACADALGKFKGDVAAGDALRRIVTGGDASARVEAAAIEAYAKVKPDDASNMVREALKRDSPREVVRSSALQALGAVSDPEAIALLMEWTAKSKPRECRSAALGALGEQAVKLAFDDAEAGRVTQLLTVTLDDPDRRVRDSAVRALGNLGRRAESALPKLRDLAASPASDRSGRSVKAALDKIEKDEPAGKQLADMRKQLDEMRAENRKLRDQVSSLEARVKADRPDTSERVSRADSAEGTDPPR